MRILWVCNIILPVVAEHLQQEVSNKEGWLTGLADSILERQQENKIILGVAFPVERAMDGCRGELTVKGSRLSYYGFYEEVLSAEKYNPELEQRMLQITSDFKPDVVHCFGTEYGHTLAMSRIFKKDRILIGIQGLCTACANAYMANLPESVQKSITFRDWVKGDSLRQQQEKFNQRGKMEVEIIRNVKNVTGRTDMDRHYTKEWNPNIRYFAMNETLRSNFYIGKWDVNHCEPYTIFLSQGDYPLKGLHYMLLALPMIRKQYPEVKVRVAGNSLINYTTLKDKIKLSGYGKYLRSIIKEYNLENQVEFLGRLDAEQMKQQYLKSGLYVCSSSLENSPNSLGEAMLLGVPCVSADVGGIPSLFTHDKDGILYHGFRTVENSFDNTCNENKTEAEKLKSIVKRLADAVIEMWSDNEKKLNYSRNARKHAKMTHDKEVNYHKMVDIYATIKEERIY